VLKPFQSRGLFVQVVELRSLPNAENTLLGIGHICRRSIVTRGGNRKLNGIELGKIASLRNGKKFPTGLANLGNCT